MRRVEHVRIPCPHFAQKKDPKQWTTQRSVKLRASEGDESRVAVRNERGRSPVVLIVQSRRWWRSKHALTTGQQHSQSNQSHFQKKLKTCRLLVVNVRDFRFQDAHHFAINCVEKIHLNWFNFMQFSWQRHTCLFLFSKLGQMLVWGGVKVMNSLHDDL